MDDEIEQIKNALRSVIQQITESGQAVSPQIRTTLSQAMAHVQSRITELRNAQSLPPGSDNLWALSGGNPQAFQSYMGNFPNPFLNRIANNPGRIANIESRLGNQITIPAGETANGIPHAPLQSSNIYGFSYNPRNKNLMVRFQGGGLYKYDNVPPLIFKTFQSGAIPAKTSGRNRYGQWWVGKKPSLGASFFNLIRDNFPYRKVA